ncbi:uncharacterized protein TEOVI_000439200 [Trypanosoma equiperdum]|uniref:Uncharacterized protein n=4 Tax=Trypanozoon TaxID=39700 RepID=Q383L7_TRYB2|nr:hypothetical protein, conserved [Trypanosoma brucei gambiense DAL972]XP_829126.1 hypothetical protein, conserved [Trypanosoma brucei brucei TREU927]RHW67742.1 hypothetical protein DPX39_110081300 [Trypanosoma brucei equiperdum]SCU72808.1 hypothetical protein, conserved [Trypanosoma equiperdum]EAN80014.1 hypothetical protein, conserved [Trypanosoma brucei brucei TREU927]CBH18072.1 hypothetical protein, conserved [Trypanosoma brucei gambiense DAL972]|eukprot:XP_011780336.1 hypothetical protein, conserved [Trypanosoma brucei gambiense DAL972]
MEDEPTQILLTREQLERSVERLSKPHSREVNLKPLCKSVRLPQEARERSIKHLYNDSMEHKERRLREIEQSLNAEIEKYHAGKPKLDSADTEGLVSRLYNESIQRKNDNLRQLFEHQVSLSRPKEKKLKKAEQQEFVTRLYQGGMEHNRKKHIALFEEHVLAREPKMAQRSPEDLEIACSKLTSGKSVTDD